jgi:hypothetical protein
VPRNKNPKANIQTRSQRTARSCAREIQDQIAIQLQIRFSSRLGKSTNLRQQGTTAKDSKRQQRKLTGLGSRNLKSRGSKNFPRTIPNFSDEFSKKFARLGKIERLQRAEMLDG